MQNIGLHFDMRKIGSLNTKEIIKIISGNKYPTPIIPGWDFVAKLSGNPIARYSSIVPIVGYIILLSDKISTFIDDRNLDFWIKNTQDKLIMIYFGFLILFVSYLTFYVSKSKITLGDDEDRFVSKQYTTPRKKEIIKYSEYVLDAVRDQCTFKNNSRQEYGWVKREAGSHLSNELTRMANFCNAVEVRRHIDAKKIIGFQDTLSQAYTFIFLRENYNRPMWRATCIILSILAYALLLIPSISTFLSVANYAIHRVLS